MCIVESFKIEASSIEAKSQRILNSFNKGAEKLGKNDVDLGHVRKVKIYFESRFSIVLFSSL